MEAKPRTEHRWTQRQRPDHLGHGRLLIGHPQVRLVSAQATQPRAERAGPVIRAERSRPSDQGRAVDLDVEALDVDDLFGVVVFGVVVFGIVVAGGGAAVTVTVTPWGANSSHVLPGRSVMGVPSVAVSTAGCVRLERVQVPVMATPSRRTTSGPDPVAVTSTSRPPPAFSTQLPMAVGTVMMTTLADEVWVPSSSLSGAPEYDRR